MLFVKSIAAACEATRRPVRRRGCSTTARAAGAAVRPGPPAAGRRPSPSGWRWTSRGRRSVGPRGAETQERHDVIGRLVCRGRRSKTFGKLCTSDPPSLTVVVCGFVTLTVLFPLLVETRGNKTKFIL